MSELQIRNNLKWEINRTVRDNDSPLLKINNEFNLKNNKHLKHLEFVDFPTTKMGHYFSVLSML
jgi:hypothetical protein